MKCTTLMTSGTPMCCRQAKTEKLVSATVAPKQFYVSPFLSRDCRYNFRIRPPGGDIAVSIHEERSRPAHPERQLRWRRARPLTDGAYC